MAKVVLRTGKIVANVILLIILYVVLIGGFVQAEESVEDSQVKIDLAQADSYRDDGQHTLAIETYENIIAQCSDANYVVLAYKGLAMSNVSVDNDAAADAIVRNLIANFSEHKDTMDAVHDIAGHSRKLGKNERAVLFFQDVIDNWPANRYVIWSCMGIAMSNIALGNDAIADDAVAKMLAEFPEDERTTQSIYSVAGYYHGREKYDKAYELYQTVITNWPDSKQAVLAQKNLAISKITHNNETADSEVDKLFTNYSKHPSSPQMAHKIAQHYLKLESYTKAIEIFQRIVETWPNDKYAVWSQRGLGIANIELGNDDDADAAVTKLLTDYAGHADAVRMGRAIGWHYDKAGKDDRARQIYQQIIADCRRSSYTITAQMELAKSHIGINNAAADAVVQTLLVDYADDPNLAESLYRIGQRYYDTGTAKGLDGAADEKLEYYRKAVSVWQIQLGLGLPPSRFTLKALWCSTVVYSQEFGEHENALFCAQRLLDGWPDYQYAWNVHYIMAKSYPHLGVSGVIDAEEVKPLIIETYQTIVDNWPDCPVAPRILHRLEILNGTEEAGDPNAAPETSCSRK